MSLTANWSYPTAVRFGAGRISEIAGACAAAGITRPLLVTDRGLAENDITTRTLDILDSAGLGRAIWRRLWTGPLVWWSRRRRKSGWSLCRRRPSAAWRFMSRSRWPIARAILQP